MFGRLISLILAMITVFVIIMALQEQNHYKNLEVNQTFEIFKKVNNERTEIYKHSLLSIEIPYKDNVKFIKIKDGDSFSTKVFLEPEKGTYYYKGLFNKKTHTEDLMVHTDENSPNKFFNLLFYINEYEKIKNKDKLSLRIITYNKANNIVANYSTNTIRIYKKAEKGFVNFNAEISPNNYYHINIHEKDSYLATAMFQWNDKNGPNSTEINIDDSSINQYIGIQLTPPIKYAGVLVAVREYDNDIPYNTELKIVNIDKSDPFFGEPEYSGGHYRKMDKIDH